MDSHDVEPITDEKWCETASVLCNSAMFYEALLVKSVEGSLRSGRRDEVEGLFADHYEVIDLHQAVVQHWRRYLEIVDPD